MHLDGSLDDLFRHIASLDRRACVELLRGVRRPALDFTDEYLESLSLESLRHTVAAACLQARKAAAQAPVPRDVA